MDGVELEAADRQRAARHGNPVVMDGGIFAVSAVLLAAVQVRHVPIARHPMLSDLKEGRIEVRSRDWYWSSPIPPPSGIVQRRFR
ncbi:hypothetical protein AB0E77_10970 [Streptomyces sp. NPDC032940]|uniref:hypothetical protein n=1 Tax=Streptomyces sp. NPDC032940 TaxID=3155366 RepID=UPI0033F4ADE6